VSAREIAKAKKAGKEWINSEITSDAFLSYAFDQVMEAEKAPDKHWLVRDKKTALQAAKNMIQNYRYELWRGLDEGDLLHILKQWSGIAAHDYPKDERTALLQAMTGAARDVLEQKTTQSWLADEVLHWSLEAAKRKA